MALTRAALPLLGALWLLPAPAAAAPPCEAAAQALLQRVERLPLDARAPVIQAALAEDDNLGCGVVAAAHWRAKPALPEGCGRAQPEACITADVLPVAPEVLLDADIPTFLRVQAAALRLSAEGQLSRPLRRLFQVLILSDAVRRGA
jgi:hypothetical protein